MSEVSFQVFRGAAGDTPIADSVTKALKPNDIHIKITHSGVCGTDEHFRHAPVALGHEGIGIVANVGSSVEGYKAGDRVGFGFVRKVCGKCENCLTGWDQYCPNRVSYGSQDPDTGSFSTGAIVDARCVFHIPEVLSSASAAPLMCGGATVWTVLSQYNIKSTDTVGVMGIGGLGHLAIKIAANMGCRVVVLSSNESKRAEALSYGASDFFVKPYDGAVIGNVPKLNHLLLCGSSRVDYASLIPLMATNGTIYPMTVDSKPTDFVAFQLVSNAVRIQGSNVGDSTSIRKLLEFAAQHKITTETQEYPLTADGIVTALGSLKEGKVRYRAVLVAGQS